VLHEGLFIRVRGETIWKFVTGPEMGVPKAATRGRRGTNRPHLATKEARSRSIRLFSKPFRKDNSPNFAQTLFSEVVRSKHTTPRPPLYPLAGAGESREDGR
jgi:hypothetical protein